MVCYDKILIKVGNATLQIEEIHEVEFHFYGEGYVYGDTEEYSSDVVKAIDIRDKMLELERLIIENKRKDDQLVFNMAKDKEILNYKAEINKLNSTIEKLQTAILKISCGEK